MKQLHILITLSLLILATAAKAAITGQWVMHPTFDNSVTRVIDTPTRTYFMGYNQQLNEVIGAKMSTDQTLFYYDKEGDEVIAANRNHALSSPAVDKIEYNPAKNYLLILYSNQDIDLLYDSGKVVNIPFMLHADIPGARKINSITFYPWNNSIWLATEFGYVVINDEKHEVSDSRNYGISLNAATQIGDLAIVATESKTYIAPISEPRTSLSDYSVSDSFQGAAWMYPLTDKKIVVSSYNPSQKNTHINQIFTVENGALHAKLLQTPWGTAVHLYPCKNGVTAMYDAITLFYSDKDGETSVAVTRPAEEAGIYTTASWDNKEFFTVIPRKGLKSTKVGEDGKSILTRDFMLPNAPNAYWSRGMVYHPKYGMLVNSHGPEQIFDAGNLNSIYEPILLSALSGGEWTPMSPAYRNPAQTGVGYDPYGLCIDPFDNKYVYSGSPFSGLVRLNLDDPNDILHYSFPGDPTANLPGYVEAAPIQPSWARVCCFSAPVFDVNNTLWTCFYDRSFDGLSMRYLTADEVKASKDAASARKWNELPIKGVKGGLYTLVRPLTSKFNANLLLAMTSEGILVYNYAGTPGVTSDDTRALVSGAVYDQDGGSVSLFATNCIYEDPQTGFVWFGTGNGVYYLQPQSILRGQTNVNRIKVARNDGTSLADYLLNGVGVNAIVTDGQDRKWFGSAGAGIVVTSADGKTLLEEFTTENSNLPSNYIYNLCYNPATGSMMVSTEKGLVEFFINGEGSNASNREEARAYPNPVAPDYFGWVTIDGLPDNSLVKIVDASGNLVRELGKAESGSIQWDVLNVNSTRVKTGVYYVLASPASGTGESKMTKILVMN